MIGSYEFNADAIVLSQAAFSEADVLLDLYVDGLGRILASSRGVKHLKSKLRYQLEPYSIIKATLIETKSNGWRLINADLYRNLYYELDGRNQQVLIRLFDLFYRVLPPQEIIVVVESFINQVRAGEYDLINNYLYTASDLLIELGYLSSPKRQEIVSSELRQESLTDKQVSYLQRLIVDSLANSQL